MSKNDPDAPYPGAQLKMVRGLGFWEWREGGVLKIELTGEGVLQDYQVDAIGGQLVEESHYAIIATENCDVYRPRGEDILTSIDQEETPEDRLLISFRKHVLPQELCDLGLRMLRKAAVLGDNRGMAGGLVDKSKLRNIAKEGEIILSGRGTRAKYRQPDGTYSAITAANLVMSGVAGNFDSSARFPYCRQTGYSKANPGPMTEVIPFIEAISERFKAQAPIRWQRQKDFVDGTYKTSEPQEPGTGIYKNGWCLGETVFTTITVNRNWRTAVHKDAGDFPGGYGNITVLEGPGGYNGGYTGFPKYRVAADVRHGDFMAMDVHQWHGNTRMTPVFECPNPEGWTEPDGENPGFERVSIVCYARDGMKHCTSLEAEWAKYLVWKAGFEAPKKVAERQLVERAEAIVQHKKDEDDFESFISEL